MKNEEKQQVAIEPIAFSSLALLMLLVFALVPYGQSTPDEQIIRARAKAEVLAYQVAQLFRESAESSESNEGRESARRMPAAIASAPAEGLMGQDPWGRAYNYRILPEGDRLRVEMRSAGPNGKPEAQNGDDVVLILSL